MTDIEKQEFNLDFYITQFRGIFKKIYIIYSICALLLLFIFYKVNTRPILSYYAASESGVLKPVVAYSESQAIKYQQANQ